MLTCQAGYGYYHFSGAKTIVNSISSTKKQLESVTKTMQDKAPEPSEILKWFRQTTTTYASFIPGAKTYVDKAFDDLDKVESKHRGEVNDIITKTYNELRSTTKSGLSMDTAVKSWSVLESAFKELGQLAADSAGEILDNHPELKDKVGGNLDQLKNMANSYGPEAKKELDQTYSQIKDVLAGGVGVGTIAKIKELIEEKVKKVQSMGDEAWKKGLEQAKPYLDKSPQIKEILEKNADALKSSNLTELWEKVKSGNTADLESYVKDATEKAKSSGLSSFGSLGKEAEKYIKMIPGGSEIFPKLQKLQQVATTHGDEAEKLLKETYDEVAKVLQQKTEQAEKLGKSAAKEAKN